MKLMSLGIPPLVGCSSITARLPIYNPSGRDLTVPALTENETLTCFVSEPDFQFPICLFLAKYVANYVKVVMLVAEV